MKVKMLSFCYPWVKYVSSFYMYGIFHMLDVARPLIITRVLNVYTIKKKVCSLSAQGTLASIEGNLN